MTSAERVDHLRGSAAEAHRRRVNERAELAADLKALADAVFCFTSADQLRNKIGRASVLRIARLAGRDPAALRDQWSEDDKKIQQQGRTAGTREKFLLAERWIRGESFVYESRHGRSRPPGQRSRG